MLLFNIALEKFQHNLTYDKEKTNIEKVIYKFL